MTDSASFAFASLLIPLAPRQNSRASEIGTSCALFLSCGQRSKILNLVRSSKMSIQKKSLISALRTGHSAEASDTSFAGTKNPVSRTPASKTPAAKTPAAKTPASKSPASKTPASKAPASKAPASKAPASKAPASKAPASKAPASKAPRLIV